MEAVSSSHRTPPITPTEDCTSTGLATPSTFAQSREASNSAFVVPPGLLLENSASGLVIEHDGDIVLHSKILGLPFSSIRSHCGSVYLHMDDVELVELSASQGDIFVNGNLRADIVSAQGINVNGRLSAREVRSSGLEVSGSLNVECVSAESSGIKVRGDARVSEELVVSGGDLVVEGNLDCSAETLSVRVGSMTVSGSANFNHADVVRDARFVQELKAIEVHVGRKLVVGGAVAATALRASAVHLRGAQVDVRVVQGQSQITMGAARVQANIFIAPSIQLDSNATGRISVVEAHELADAQPPLLKGCLPLNDLAELLGEEHVDKLLCDNGLQRLPGAGCTTHSAPSMVEPLHDIRSQQKTADVKPGSAAVRQLDLADDDGVADNAAATKIAALAGTATSSIPKLALQLDEHSKVDTGVEEDWAVPLRTSDSTCVDRKAGVAGTEAFAHNAVAATQQSQTLALSPRTQAATSIQRVRRGSLTRKEFELKKQVELLHLMVTIVGATNLKSMNWSGDAPWCRCQGQRLGKKIETRAISGTLNPRWDEEHQLEWIAGENLLFTIYDEGSVTSKTEGVVTLPSDLFYPDGFEGKLPIPGLGDGSALLEIKVFPVAQDAF